ncbi:predicted protein [Chaetoceros tenuissimus]|uniref:PDZ domain-containing protein n=1 Tax=Chaetoceros tenuissimus TaxID=426638 RepID=A0AAD3CX87_9STRA|nr:predicted protein [Chaetoceros tenuissimus]
MNTSNNIQYPLTTAAKCLLQGYDLNFLREDYEKEALSISFEDCKRHYIEYLLAEITAHSLLLVNNSLRIIPPLHVDKLWKLHVQETRDYRQFEKYVLFIYRQSGRATNLVHLDYSNKDSRNRREERLEQTKSLYQIAGLVFVNSDEEQQVNDGNDMQNISIQERSQQVMAKSNVSVSNTTGQQYSSHSSIPTSEKEIDQETNSSKSKHNEEERSKEVSLSNTSQQSSSSTAASEERSKEVSLPNTNQQSSSSTAASEKRKDQAVKHEQSEDQNTPSETSDSQIVNVKLDLPDNLLAPSEEHAEKKIFHIKVPPGPLGVNIVDNEAGVYVQTKTSDRTELLVGDIIRCVGNIQVKTLAECTHLIRNNVNSERTLTIERSVSKPVGESKKKKIFDIIKVPSGPLGVTIADNEAGVYVQTKSSDRTKLLVGDIIHYVGNVPVKTIAECTKAIQKDFHVERTLTIERNISQSVGESNLEQNRPPEQMNEHPALSGLKRSYQEAIKSDSDEVRKLGKPDESKEGSTYEDAIVLDE